MADNSSRRFKFISPGVFVEEVDNSQLPALPTAVGPIVIGRSLSGPANIPVTINSFSDFVQTFGNPVPGGSTGDVWRDGDDSAPTYAPFAAKAWLTNNGPVTFMRVLGDESDQATSAGKAGWKVGTAGSDDTGADSGGVYALVVWPSGSVSTKAPSVVTGSVAAQIYVNTGKVMLSGTAVSTLTEAENGSTLYEVSDIDSFVLHVTGSNLSKKATVSLNPSSENFIRKVLNTNPTIMNSSITTAATRTYYQGGEYFLGESFERSLTAKGTESIGVLSAGITTGKIHAAVFPMAQPSGSYAKQQNDFEGAAIRGTTGWFISQDLSNNNGVYYASEMQKLFRLEAITAGEFAQKEVKISIANIKAPEGDYQDYGTFSILVRRLGDTDASPQVIERFDNLDLNPASPNYIAKQIGDRYQRYDKSNLRNVEYGQYDNQSNYIRVVMDEDVAAGAGETRWLPFGVWGPPKYRNVSVVSGSGGWSSDLDTPVSGVVGGVNTMLAGGPSTTFGLAGHTSASLDILQLQSDQGFSGSIVFPSVPLRQLDTWGTPRSLRNTYWGAWTGRSATETFYSDQVQDLLRPRSFDVQSAGENANPAATTYDVEGQSSTSAGTESIVTSWVFSLDDISGSAAAGYTYAAGLRRSGDSLSAPVDASYKTVLSAGIDRFTTLIHGGSTGYDITQREPFQNNAIGTNEKANYELYSLRKAINIISDSDYVQGNAVAIPGVTKPAVTDFLLETAEMRGDLLAIVDIEKAYTPDTETNLSQYDANEGNTPSAAATALQGRSINNSYGATYYPWVRMLDTNTNQSLWVPPSVPALGVLSTTDRLQAPWFAPAGFTRGGLSEGAAGIPVLDVSQRLSSEERDTLYEVNINPIAKFPAEGIVIFGQKTLQQTSSALDRINVRRLMIFLKREISFIASRLLFSPNVQDTWDRFLGQASPLLESVKAQFGIDDFRLALDDATTTPDLIDRNIIYAKLLVKPTRTVEFFAIDFVVTNSGAAFDD